MNPTNDLVGFTDWMVRLLGSIADTGELTEESEAILADVGGQFQERVGDVCRLIAFMNRRQCGLAEEIAKLQVVSTAYTKSSQQLRGKLLEAMTKAEMDTLETGIYRVRRKKSPGHLTCTVDGLAALPDELCVIERRPDAKAVMQLIRVGQPMPEGVEIVQGEHVEIRVI